MGSYHPEIDETPEGDHGLETQNFSEFSPQTRHLRDCPLPALLIVLPQQDGRDEILGTAD